MWATENRGRYDRSKLRYPSDLTDAEWDLDAAQSRRLLHSELGYVSPAQFKDQHARQSVKTAA